MSFFLAAAPVFFAVYKKLPTLRFYLASVEIKSFEIKDPFSSQPDIISRVDKISFAKYAYSGQYITYCMIAGTTSGHQLLTFWLRR